jgi:predicted RNase H-like nuclease (RuvC/YqgF family)
MVTTENKSSQEWQQIITDLSAKTRGLETEVTEFIHDRDGLTLDAELGIDGAGKRIQKLSTEIAGRQTSLQNLKSAITQAQARLAESRKAEAAEAERERQLHIAAVLREYSEEITAIDSLLVQLASRFQSAKLCLDRACDLMTSEEQTPIQQLRSLWGPTLAAAHVGLGDFLELGPKAGNYTHRQPLLAFIGPFVNRWLKREE